MTEFDFLEHLPSVLPELGLMILALVVLASDVGFFVVPSLPGDRKHLIPYIAGIGLAALAITPLAFPPDPDRVSYWGGMVHHDILSQIFKVMVMLAGAITCLIAADTSYLREKGEFYLIIIVATLGACLMSSASDLIMVFVALETVSIPLYILAAFRREDVRSAESGLKYFLFGSFASAIMLYGFSLLYGFTGQTNLDAIATFLGSPEFGDNLVPLLVALVFVIVGFGFKISATRSGTRLSPNSGEPRNVAIASRLV